MLEHSGNSHSLVLFPHKTVLEDLPRQETAGAPRMGSIAMPIGNLPMACCLLHRGSHSGCLLWGLLRHFADTLPSTEFPYGNGSRSIWI